jgi:hypothetical protein
VPTVRGPARSSALELDLQLCQLTMRYGSIPELLHLLTDDFVCLL